MSRLKDLRERLAKAYTRMEELRKLDSEGKWDAQAEEAWKGVNDEYDAARRSVEVEERCEAAQALMTAPAATLPGAAAASAAAGRQFAPEARSRDRDDRSRRSERRSGRGRRGLTRDEQAREVRERQMLAEAWAAHQFEDHEPEDLLSEEHLDLVEERRARRLVEKRTFWGRIDQRRIQNLQRRMGEKRAAMTTATDPEIIDETWESQLEKQLAYFGPMLQVADVRVTPRGGDVHWNTLNDVANEGVEVAEVTDPGNQEAAFGEIVFNAYKYTSKFVLVSAELIEDSIHDVPRILGELIGERLGRILNRRFTTGDGSSKPQGWAVTGGATSVATAGVGALVADDLITLVHSIDPAYRGAGRTAWQINDAVVASIRKLKDSEGNYLWASGLQSGQPDMLLGYRVLYNNVLAAAIATGNVIAGFGDWSAYKVRMVRGVRLKRLVERYAELDQEAFVGFLRADGRLINTTRVKRLTVA